MLPPHKTARIRTPWPPAAFSPRGRPRMRTHEATADPRHAAPRHTAGEARSHSTAPELTSRPRVSRAEHALRGAERRRRRPYVAPGHRSSPTAAPRGRTNQRKQAPAQGGEERVARGGRYGYGAACTPPRARRAPARCSCGPGVPRCRCRCRCRCRRGSACPGSPSMSVMAATAIVDPVVTAEVARSDSVSWLAVRIAKPVGDVLAVRAASFRALLLPDRTAPQAGTCVGAVSAGSRPARR